MGKQMNNEYRPEDEIKFENLIKNPLRLFGIVYPYFALILLTGGVYWVYNLDWAYKNTLKPQILMRDTVAEPIVMKKGSIMAGVDVKLVSVSNPDFVTKGAELFKANCSSCHGEAGKGNGIAGKTLNPQPRNFTVAEGWKNGRKISEMWKTLEEGIAGGGMVSYNYLPVQDRFALIHYIHSLMSDAPKDTDAELAQLDATYKLSEGKITANQIPVANAILALQSDFKSDNDKAGFVEKNLVYYRNEPGAKIIVENTKDLRKAVVSLLRSNDWKTSQSNLLSEIKSNINTNGFKTSALRLSNTDIQLMYDYLLKTFSQI
jgi:mono/diheme cytochrome c family protein